MEDADLLVINKPAGLVVHPGAGVPDGTLVNALLHHCGDELSGIGGARRPGIVHRLDKDTSGILVVAKTDVAHQGLANQFAAQDVERIYEALTWGVPSAADPKTATRPGVSVTTSQGMRIERPIGRDPRDRLKMAVVEGGRHAVTHVSLKQTFGRVSAAIACQLETGRTHQIRVHLAHIGHPLIGDPVYATGRSIPAKLPKPTSETLKHFTRQALHAGVLGFRHPVSKQDISFKMLPPTDYLDLQKALTALE